MDRDPIDLGLHRCDRLASLGDSLHDYGHSHSQQLVIASSQRPAEFAGDSGVCDPFVGTSTIVPGEFSAFVFGGAQPGLGDTGAGRDAATLVSAGTDATRIITALLAAMAGTAPGLCGWQFRGFPGGLAGVVATDRLVFSPDHPGQPAGQPR